LWDKVASINHEVKTNTGSPLWNITESLQTTKAAIFLWHFILLHEDFEGEGCGLSKEESDVFLRNICKNGIFKKGKFYIDWEDPKLGWMNYLLDVLAVAGRVERS
jgi:hypothetical protein